MSGPRLPEGTVSVSEKFLKDVLHLIQQVARIRTGPKGYTNECLNEHVGEAKWIIETYGPKQWKP